MSGYYHWSGAEEMTKYDMAVVMAELFSLPTDHIIGDKQESAGAPRAYNSKLECSRLKSLGLGHQTTFGEGIRPYLLPWAKRSNSIKVKIHVE